MKNWKTTILAILSNIAYLIICALQLGGITTKDIILAMGLQAVATAAKDSGVTGR